MYREQSNDVTSQQSTEADATSIGGPDRALPPALLARLNALGPGDAELLASLVIAHPQLATKILTTASWKVGLSAVRRAIAIAEASGAKTDLPANDTDTDTANHTDTANQADAATQTDAANDAEGAMAPSSSSGEPSALVVSTARRYNLAHSHHVAIFNEATSHRFVGSDGQPEPARVWHWQRQHGIGHDGRIGPQTSSTAVAVARRGRAAATAAQAPAPEPAAPESVATTEPAAPESVATTEPATSPVTATSPSTPAVERATKPSIPAAQTVAKPSVSAVEPATTQSETADTATSPSAKAAEPAAKPSVPAVEPATSASVASIESKTPSSEVEPQAVAPNVAGAGGPPTEAAGQTSAEIPAVGMSGSGGGGGGGAAPAVPARVDNGGPGSLARRTLAANGGADAAFAYLVSDNDGVLDRNLADYGSVAEQRALLDGVITQGADAVRVRRAFHVYWHVQLVAAGQGTKNVREWPVPTLQSIHHQLKLLPDQDARSGAWKTLSLSDEGRKQGRGWYDETGNFALGQDVRGETARKMNDGYFEYVMGEHRAGAMQVRVSGGERFKPGDKIVINRGESAQEVATVSAVEGNTYTLATALQRDHKHASVMELQGGGGKREINWLDYTVRHEIAHSLDGRAIDTKGFYAKGGWATYDSFDSWLKAMGGESAWATNDGAKIPDEDRIAIKGAIGSAVMMRQTGSLFDRFRSDDPKTQHPIVKYEHKQVPVIVAAQTSMNMGDGFVHRPTELYAFDNKRFSVSNMYAKFQVCSETAVTDRVSDYSLTAPAEFFADTYALFYEEAGKPGITDADYGRQIRNADWRTWFREHVHDRGHGPAGTGAAKKGDGTLADDHDHGAHPGGASVGRAAGNPGAEHG